MDARWSSVHEYVVGPVELEAEAALVRRDDALGREAARRYGLVVPAPASPGLRTRVVGRLRRSRIAPLADLLRRRLRRERRRLRIRIGRAGGLPGLLTVVGEPDDLAGFRHALDGVRTEWTAILRGGGRLHPDAAGPISEAIGRRPDVELWFGDARRPNGARVAAPDYSVFRMREEDVLGPVVVVATDALRTHLAEASEAISGAELLDFVLSRDPARIGRIDDVIGVAGPGVLAGARAEAARAVVAAELERVGAAAGIELAGDVRRVAYEPAGRPLVSIVIPTRGGGGTVGGRERVFVVEAVRSILRSTSWPDFELVVVADDPTPQAVVDELAELAGDRLRLVRWSEPFNFSRKMNRGAVAARGEYLLLLNDDTELLTGDWLERLLGLAAQPHVGMVGAALYFEDGSIQHLGHLYDRGAPGHVEFGAVARTPRQREGFGVTREVSGVTAACALVSAERFAAVGGCSVELPGNYNDVDLAQKISDAGGRILCAGRVRLYHFESRTRDAAVRPEETAVLLGRWGRRLQVDGFSQPRR